MSVLASAPFGEVLEFLRGASFRYCVQERELGLDIYLSGAWAWVPTLLLVSAATIFLLALFRVIPTRKRSVPLLICTGLLAALIGGSGTYIQMSDYLGAEGGAEFPRVFVEGQGREPTTPAHEAALLALPLSVGGGTLMATIFGGLFLIIFGGRGRSRGGEDDEDADDEE